MNTPETLQLPTDRRRGMAILTPEDDLCPLVPVPLGHMRCRLAPLCRRSRPPLRSRTHRTAPDRIRQRMDHSYQLGAPDDRYGGPEARRRVASWAMRTALGLLLVAALLLTATAMPVAGEGDYPARDAGYHSYPEMVRHIKQVAADHPGIVRLFSIGRSHEGRKLWAAEVSDRVGVDEGEPEVLFDGLHHAREHLSGEMPIYILDLLTSQYGRPSDLGKRVTRLVDKRRTWIIFMVNPDGLQHDLTGSPYRGWRLNRQPIAGSRKVGTDLNRNYGYRWGCCGGSSGKPGAWNYRGPRAWSAPETRAVRDFVNSRVVDGRQRIRTHISFHTAGEMVLWPYAYTRRDLPPDMTSLDLAAFRAMGKAMARTNGYRPMQSSDLYPSDGDLIDWLYHRHRIFAFTFELYPRGGKAPARWYPPDEIIGRETKRNRGAVLYLMGKALCPYSALGRRAVELNCGPLFDDFEIKRGWKVDPRGTDTARDGRWQRGRPVKDTLQLGSAFSGSAALVTGRTRGHDVDGGRTTIRSPWFTVPADGKATLRLRYWVGLNARAGAGDGFSVRVVGKDGKPVRTLHRVRGDERRRAPVWKSLVKPLPRSLAGQRAAIELVAVDAAPGAVVEVGVDHVRVTAE
jgi:carboxypeptidase T